MKPLIINKQDYFQKSLVEFNKTRSDLNLFALEKIKFISVNSWVGKLDPKQKQDVKYYM